MSGLMDKIKGMAGGDSTTKSTNLGDQDLPGNIVEASGGTYDAGPGVKGTKTTASTAGSSNRKDNPTSETTSTGGHATYGETSSGNESSRVDDESTTIGTSRSSGGDAFESDPTSASGGYSSSDQTAQTSDYSTSGQTAQTSDYSSGAGYSSGTGEIQQGRVDLSKYTSGNVTTIGEGGSGLEEIRQHATTGYGSGAPTDQIEGYSEGNASTLRGALRGESTTTGDEYGGDGVGVTGGSGLTQGSTYGSSGQGVSGSSGGYGDSATSGTSGYEDTTSSSRAKDTTTSSSSADYDTTSGSGSGSGSGSSEGYGHKSAIDSGSGANATGPARDSTTTDLRNELYEK